MEKKTSYSQRSHQWLPLRIGLAASESLGPIFNLNEYVTLFIEGFSFIVFLQKSGEMNNNWKNKTKVSDWPDWATSRLNAAQPGNLSVSLAPAHVRREDMETEAPGGRSVNVARALGGGMSGRMTLSSSSAPCRKSPPHHQIGAPRLVIPFEEEVPVLLSCLWFDPPDSGDLRRFGSCSTEVGLVGGGAVTLRSLWLVVVCTVTCVCCRVSCRTSAVVGAYHGLIDGHHLRARDIWSCLVRCAHLVVVPWWCAAGFHRHHAIVMSGACVWLCSRGVINRDLAGFPAGVRSVVSIMMSPSAQTAAVSCFER